MAASCIAAGGEAVLPCATTPRLTAALNRQVPPGAGGAAGHLPAYQTIAPHGNGRGRRSKGAIMKRQASGRIEAAATPSTRLRYKSSRTDINAERARFAEYLEHKNLKLTRQRELLLEEIFNDGGHFEAEELVERLKHRDTRVSRATVYRTLELLQECSLVEKINFGTTRSFYEHVSPGQHHDHIICTRCGTVIEFMDERIEALQEEVCRKHGLELTHHSMRLFGVCRQCRQTRAN